MGFFDNFPYSNFHEMNLDWILKQIVELKKYIENYTAINNVSYAGTWNIEKGYSAWSIVTYGDASYISVKPVPVGVEIENEEYWMKLADVDPRITELVARIGILENDVAEIQWHYRNVKHYGAIGDGVTDCYPAFKKAMTGGTGIGIYVPFGTYYLSENPLIKNQSVQFLFDIGAKFIGPGVGNKETGAGEFASTYITNPWLLVAGDYKYYNLNKLDCPKGGAIVGDSKELFDMDNGTDRRWYSLEYRGGATGSVDSDQRNVELLNQVINVTGFAGIVQEIDLNMYANPNRWSTGLFITGRGTGGGDMSAIDITRDDGQQKWSTAISVRRADTGIYLDNSEIDTCIQIGENPRKATPAIAFQQKKNGADGLVIRRFTDTSPTGNLIVAWDAKEENELFALTSDGEARLDGFPIGMVDTRTHVNGKFERYGFSKNGCMILLKRGAKFALIAVDYWSSGYSLLAGSVDGLTIQKDANTRYVDISNNIGSSMYAVAIG